MSVTARSLSLETVAENFARWRSSPKKSRKIPTELMDQACSLVQSHQMAAITAALRLSYADFKKQCELRGVVKGRCTETATFVEVLQPAAGTGSNAISIELHRPDGAKMQINAIDTATVAAVMASFLRG